MLIHARNTLFAALALFAAPLALPVGTGTPGALAQEQPVPPRPLPDALQQRPPARQAPQRPQTSKPETARPETAKPAPKGPPPLPSDPAKRLEALFERLRDAENLAAAKTAEAEIEKIFERSGSATTDLIFERSKQALVAKDFPLALDLLDYVTALKPDFAEAYHRRALVHVLQKDEEAALRDLRLTLGHQPRHFQALAGLGMVLNGLGDKKGAYRALTRVKELNPLFPEIGEQIEKLRLDVEGQPI